MKTYLILNGPNLNRLGQREPLVYGSKTLADLEEDLRAFADARGVAVTFLQSNHEGDLVDAIQSVASSYDGCVINAGGYSHTSVAIRDAIASVDKPFVEVHISNIYAREAFRHTSLLSGVCRGVVAGFGFDGYRFALEALL